MAGMPMPSRTTVARCGMLALRFGLVAGLVAAAARVVRPADLVPLGRFLRDEPAPALAALAAYAAAFALRALAWQVLLPGGSPGAGGCPAHPGAGRSPLVRGPDPCVRAGAGTPAARLSYATLWRLTLAANLVNHLAPGKLGEVTRIALAARAGLPRALAVVSVVQARVVDTAALLAAAGVALALSLGDPRGAGLGAGGAVRVGGYPPGDEGSGPAGGPGIAPAASPLGAVVALALLAGVLVPLVLAAGGRGAPRLARRWPRLAPLAEAVAAVPGRRLAAAWLLSAASWPLEAGLLAVVARGLGLDLDPAAVVAVTLAAVAGQVLALTPGGLGTYEANMTLVLQLYGVAPSAAFQAALCTHLAKYVFAVVAGLEPAWRLAGGPALLLRRARAARRAAVPGAGGRAVSGAATALREPD